MAKATRTPLKAIRAKCLDCCCNNPNEVRLCPAVDCPLHEYRRGSRPSTIEAREERKRLKDEAPTEVLE